MGPIWSNTSLSSMSRLSPTFSANIDPDPTPNSAALPNAAAGFELSPTLVFDYPATNALATHLSSLLPAPPLHPMPQSPDHAARAAAGDASVTIAAGVHHTEHARPAGCSFWAAVQGKTSRAA